MNLTPKYNEMSVDSVREQIRLKNQGPYLANAKTVNQSITDMDHFPYTRWFRGVYYFPDPIVAERKAGFRPLEEHCYNYIIPKSIQTPDGEISTEPDNDFGHVYQASCSTVFPTFSQNNPNAVAQMALNDNINKYCVVQYR